uniref:Uncharacterized protein n=1 Tax=Schizaphis graminum TaxID=13262 RepID=A0A2S2NKQ8_SCHGA
MSIYYDHSTGGWCTFDDSLKNIIRWRLETSNNVPDYVTVGVGTTDNTQYRPLCPKSQSPRHVHTRTHAHTHPHVLNDVMYSMQSFRFGDDEEVYDRKTPYGGGGDNGDDNYYGGGGCAFLGF